MEAISCVLKRLWAGEAARPQLAPVSRDLRRNSVTEIVCSLAGRQQPASAVADRC